LCLRWILIVALALGPAAAAAEEFHRTAGDGDQFTQWNVFNSDNSDLPTDDVQALAKADGALWIGTGGGGLARLADGQWQVYTADNSDLPGDDVRALAAAEGALWVGTKGGGLARVANGQWQVYTTANSHLPNNDVLALAVGDDALWVGTDGGGLARLADGQWQVYTAANSNLPDDYVQVLAEGDGALWIGMRGGGLARLADGQWEVFTVANSGLPDDDVLALVMGDGALWVGTASGGLARFTDGQWQVYTAANSDLPGEDIRALLAADGALWVGTGGGGLARFGDGHWKVYTAGTGDLPDDDVLALIAADGALWVGTWGGGLARRADGQWQVYTPANSKLPDDYVRTLATTNGELWVGTWEDGLARLAGGQWQLFTTASGDLPNDHVQALVSDNDTLWVGMRGGGLARLAGGQWQVFTAANSGLPDNDVRAVAAGNGALWVGTAGGGLARLADGQWQVYTTANSDLPANDVRALAVGNGALWVGTWHGGLARLADGHWQAYTPVNSNLPDDDILALALGDGGLWVGTAGRGLARLVDGQWQVHTAANSGLPDDDVLTLAMGDGGLWVGTGGGGLAHLANDQWQVYTPANSDLPDDDVLSLAATDDRLWIGTRGGGLARFEPAMVQPEIVILVGAGEGTEEIPVKQAQHMIAARAFDPSYRTPESLFRFEWTLQTAELLGPTIIDRLVSRAAYYTARFKKDGQYLLTVVAIDRYGKRSKPRDIKVAVSLPKESPWRDRALDIGKATGGALLLYFLAVFPLLFLYPRAGWARTMLNSGFFSRFPILHRLVLNSGWARRRIFYSCASRESTRAAVPDPYIPQFVYPRGQRAPESLPIGDDVDYLPSLLGSTNRCLLMARSGTGKSVLLQRILQVCGRAFLYGNYRYLPILIDLRTSPVASRTVEQLIHDGLKGGQVELPEDQLDFMIVKGGFLLLIDSINEAPSEAVAAAFHPFLNRSADNAVIMASQVDVLERSDMPAFNLAEVTPELAREHLTKAVGRDIWDDLSLDAQALTRNPQDLTLLIEVVNALGPAKVPTHRAELYRAILGQDSALADWIKTGDPSLSIVYALAFHMFGEERVLATDRLRDWLLKEMRDTGADHKERLNDLMDRISRSSLFREETAINLLGQATPVIGFRHELIGKFLAARHLRPAIEQRKLETLDEWVELSRDVRWLDVFCFAIDELTDHHALNAMLDWLLVDANEVQERIVAYAIGTRADGIRPRVLQEYAAAKLDEDLRRTPAARGPRNAATA
jgi:ligand-binding sensor domain-containing protein